VVAGDLIILTNCQTTGYKDGQVGIITKVENIGLYNLYWIAMGDGLKVPMWAQEFQVLTGSA
jgi:hypothetical protein|tara:strand:- start:1751 stop:1936 length:186 start_codon:yes stop_codon:yes gene_type:complete